MDEQRSGLAEHEATRLETLGRLTSGVAHEINTPIQYIGDNTTFLRDAFAQLLAVVDTSRLDDQLRFIVDEVPQAVEQTLHGIDHVARIVRALRQFGHDSPEPIAVEASELIDQALMLSRNRWKRLVRVRAEPVSPLPPICVRPGDLVQTVLNLVVNAAHAVEDRYGAASIKQGSVRVTAEPAGGRLRISVVDNGCGIPEALRARVFERFFTTKGDGRGSGQGLAIVRAICERDGWPIELESSEEIGTTITVSVPFENGGDR